MLLMSEVPLYSQHEISQQRVQSTRNQSTKSLYSQHETSQQRVSDSRLARIPVRDFLDGALVMAFPGQSLEFFLVPIMSSWFELSLVLILSSFSLVLILSSHRTGTHSERERARERARERESEREREKERARER